MLLCGLRPKQLQNYPICPCVRSGNILMDIVCQHWKLWDKRISRWSQRLCGGVEQMLRRIPIKSFLLRTTPFKSFCWLWINILTCLPTNPHHEFSVPVAMQYHCRLWSWENQAAAKFGTEISDVIRDGEKLFLNKSEEEKSLKLRRRKKGNFKYFHKYPPPPLTH